MTSRNLVFSIPVLCLVLISGSCNRGVPGTLSTGGATSVSYNFDIRPILSDKCFVCHGPDANKREAELRLDLPEGAYAALKDDASRHALVPGKPEESEVYHRISSKDPNTIMPPPESNLSLTEQEIDLINRWISQGATYENHWAFNKIRKPPVPENDHGTNEIDRFIYEALERRNLTPNREAEPHALIKRASLDLTGLPPSEALLEKYAGFKTPHAYENLIDELLQEPAFGEKLAILWLDVARYSDSYGYQDDEYRTQWPFRDWVIHAFNENMPYDTFLEWQLAGDLLPHDTPEQHDRHLQPDPDPGDHRQDQSDHQDTLHDEPMAEPDLGRRDPGHRGLPGRCGRQAAASGAHRAVPDRVW